MKQTNFPNRTTGGPQEGIKQPIKRADKWLWYLQKAAILFHINCTEEEQRLDWSCLECLAAFKQKVDFAALQTTMLKQELI